MDQVPPKRLGPALCLGSLLALAPSLAAQGLDWIGALQGRLDALDRMLSAPRAADIEQVDLYGRDFRLRDLRGRVVLLSFLDRDSVGEAVEWLERQTTWLLHQEGVSFVNVFYPGGVFFLIPRGEAVHRIRTEVAEARERMIQGLPEDEKALLAAADIRWLVDWKRRLSSRYPVERGRANVFLLDELGRIREVYRYDPGDPPDRIRGSVEALLAHRKEGARRGEDL